ncbi:helix-turn-helix domain-containing protein [Salipiger abyssi]|uniref:helix-turn-helix domain-containing protein n=1 Tax=Salipiger abyssi TaxID=1250539 RepID=UPI001A8DB10C|nr:helix-turn-helix domain-containing protein [Salipiger abyssi]MBN9888144.1 hypothetical protein [Salipiger abyssi]
MTTLMSAAQPRGQTIEVCPNTGSSRRAVDRWELLSLVTELRRPLGLADRDVMVLRAHLSVLPHGPLDPAGLNVSFMNIAEILNRACGMEERRFRRGEARLEQLGLVRRNLSANGRRFPERDANGKIVFAYGIDLAPLLARYHALLALRDDLEEQRQVLRQRKNRVSAAFSAILRSLASRGTSLPHCLDALRERLRNALRRKTTSHAELDEIEAEIDRLTANLQTTESFEPDQCDEPKTAVLPDIEPVDAGQTVRHIESKPKEKNYDQPDTFNQHELSELWAQTESIGSFYPKAPTNEKEAIGILLDFSSFMGLNETEVAKTLVGLGWTNTVLALDYLAEKLASLKSPKHYLMTMVKRFEDGQPIARGRIVPSRSVGQKKLA